MGYAVHSMGFREVHLSVNVLEYGVYIVWGILGMKYIEEGYVPGFS